MSLLFSPYSLRDLTLRNRIVMAPMCMYTAGEDGLATDWHLVHLGARAIGGAGMLITEATAVHPAGRISRHDLGLWDDSQIEPLRRIVRLCQSQGAAMCTQLGHAGRKAWSPTKGVGPFQPVGPSAIAHDGDWVVPHALTAGEIDALVEDFAAAARRAESVGYDAIELHAAHGYLLHEFLSPLANKRTDEYGGSLENRARFLMRTATAVRSAWPAGKPLIVRLSCTDWVAGGLVVEDLVQVAAWLKAQHIDLIDCSSGGVATVVPPTRPGYQVPFAGQIRRDAGIATGAVGLITEAQHAEEILLNGNADLIILGRELLRNPQWPLAAAHALGVDIPWPAQYVRAKL